MSGTSSFDVIVVGAGLVGGALALLLARSGFAVAVVERGTLVKNWDPERHGRRVSALNLGSERLLKHIDAWPLMEQRWISRYLKMFVWDAAGPGRIEFDCAELGATHLGTVVDNDLVVVALHQQLSAHAAVTLVTGAELSAVTPRARDVMIELSSGDRLYSALLVGADGAGSQVRSLTGIGARTHGFGQVGIVSRVSTELHHQQTAWQRFLPTGPLAFLPLSNGDSSIVWSCEQGAAERLMALDDDDFRRTLADAFQSKLGAVTACGARDRFELKSTHADRYVHERSVLVGDAAHVVHPLAGQGANLGFADAAALAEVLVGARSRNRDVGGRLTLRRYERWRKGENLAMSCAMRGFNGLFGTDWKPAALVRGLGLRLADGIAPLKRVLAYRAMGVSGDLPHAMRPAGRPYDG